MFRGINLVKHSGSCSFANFYSISQTWITGKTEVTECLTTPSRKGCITMLILSFLY